MSHEIFSQCYKSIPIIPTIQMSHLEFNIGWLSIDNIDKCREYKLMLMTHSIFSFNQKTECEFGEGYGRGGG